MNGDPAPALVLGRYDADELLELFREEGVLGAIRTRGYDRFAFEVLAGDGPLAHARLHGHKAGNRHLLLDTCLSEVRLDADTAPRCGYAGTVPVELLVVYWLREQDPTAAFDPVHPRLPLQQHPGLGVLRHAFRVALRIARERSRDAIAALPKFYHDAAIFCSSRLFLFLDPREQGRFEALQRDLAGLSLADASVAMIGDAVHGRDGRPTRWQPGFLVMPLGERVTEWLHSASYQQTVGEEAAANHFTLDVRALDTARRLYAERGLGTG